MSALMAQAPTASRGRRQLLFGILIGIAIPTVAWAGLMAWERGAEEGDGPEDWLGEYVPSNIPTVLGEPEPARIVYLNREGARLTAGTDNSNENVSSLVRGAGLTHADVPAFHGTPRRWGEILACVRDRFSSFDVQIVDQRPVGADYVMVMVGGRPDILEGGEEEEGEHHHDRSNTTGLAPFNGQVIADAIVMVFSRKLRAHARRTCETIGMEVAHAYGLDHAMHCGELMSYLRPCGRRRFRDEDLECGEHEARKCNESTGDVQNSHQRLLEIFGPSAG
jgi:hypothetical protein